MHLKTLNLANFKNLSNDFEFHEGVNVINAPNGSGKTNILEAIYILGNSTSFNSYPDINLINYTRPDFAKISSIVGSHTYEVVVSLSQEQIRKKFLIDGSPKSASKFSSNFDVLVFSPVSVDLIAGAPDIRRSQLDSLISSLDDDYRKKLTTYKSIVKNRNKLLYKLKYGKGSIDELEFWNDKQIDLGIDLIEKRLEVIEKLNSTIKLISTDIFHTKNNELRIIYQPSIDILGDLKYNFEKLIIDKAEDEIRIGYSLFGPHRDDLEFNLSGQNAKISASRGQQRICSMLFTFAAWDMIKNQKNQKPILLLDDIMSELDIIHQENIMRIVNNGDYGQIIISTSDLNFPQINIDQIIEL